MSDNTPQRLTTIGYEADELAAHISQLLLAFYDKTGAKVEAIELTDLQLPDGNAPGWYVHIKLKQEAQA